MKLELDTAALKMAGGQTLRIRDAVGSLICAREGTLWITEENDPRDVVLQAGGCFRVDQPGLTLVTAFADASVSLA